MAATRQNPLLRIGIDEVVVDLRTPSKPVELTYLNTNRVRIDGILLDSAIVGCVDSDARIMEDSIAGDMAPGEDAVGAGICCAIPWCGRARLK